METHKRGTDPALNIPAQRGHRPHMHHGGIAPNGPHRLHLAPLRPQAMPDGKGGPQGWAAPGDTSLGAARGRQRWGSICLFACLWPRRGWRGSSPRGRCRSGCRGCSPSSARPRAAPAPAGSSGSEQGLGTPGYGPPPGSHSRTHGDDVSGFHVEAGQVVVVAVVLDGAHLQSGRGVCGDRGQRHRVPSPGVGVTQCAPEVPAPAAGGSLLGEPSPCPYPAASA